MECGLHDGFLTMRGLNASVVLFRLDGFGRGVITAGKSCAEIRPQNSSSDDLFHLVHVAIYFVRHARLIC